LDHAALTIQTKFRYKKKKTQAKWEEEDRAAIENADNKEYIITEKPHEELEA